MLAEGVLFQSPCLGHSKIELPATVPPPQITYKLQHGYVKVKDKFGVVCPTKLTIKDSVHDFLVCVYLRFCRADRIAFRSERIWQLLKHKARRSAQGNCRCDVSQTEGIEATWWQ